MNDNKKYDIRPVPVGFFTTRDVKKFIEAEANAAGRSVSRHLHLLAEERMNAAKKGKKG